MAHDEVRKELARVLKSYADRPIDAQRLALLVGANDSPTDPRAEQ